MLTCGVTFQALQSLEPVTFLMFCYRPPCILLDHFSLYKGRWQCSLFNRLFVCVSVLGVCVCVWRPAEGQGSSSLPQRLRSQTKKLLQEVGSQGLRPGTGQDQVRLTHRKQLIVPSAKRERLDCSSHSRCISKCDASPTEVRLSWIQLLTSGAVVWRLHPYTQESRAQLSVM